MSFCFSSLNCFSSSLSTSSSSSSSSASSSSSLLGALSDHSERGDSQTLSNLHGFLYAELKMATDGFHFSNKIGEGGFGYVYKGRLKDGKIVAVKVLSVKSKQGEKEFMSEIASVSNINHANLVKLLGGCIDGPLRILVYEFMENNSLAQIFQGGDQHRAILSWKSRKEIVLGIARALAYIHEEVKPHIVHRDIKLSNILLDQNFKPKLSDFGLSRLFYENITHLSTGVAGTLGYLAPEYAVSGRLTRKSDVYSFGVLLLEIVSGRSAIDFDVELGEFFLVEKAWEMYKSKKLLELVDPVLKGTLSSESEQEVVKFLKVGLLCVQEKCKLRPYMSKAINMMMMKNEEMLEMDLQISNPGLITNIMDVKIGNNRRCTSFTKMLSPQSQTKYKCN